MSAVVKPPIIQWKWIGSEALGCHTVPPPELVVVELLELLEVEDVVPLEVEDVVPPVLDDVAPLVLDALELAEVDAPVLDDDVVLLVEVVPLVLEAPAPPPCPVLAWLELPELHATHDVAVRAPSARSRARRERIGRIFIGRRYPRDRGAATTSR